MRHTALWQQPQQHHHGQVSHPAWHDGCVHGVCLTGVCTRTRSQGFDVAKKALLEFLDTFKTPADPSDREVCVRAWGCARACAGPSLSCVRRPPPPRHLG
jgi:hypothetical protein